jgi:hypothetical protein
MPTQRHTPTIAIFVTAAIWTGFALWLGIDPQALLAAFGVEQPRPELLTEIRAFYGGVELGIAITMIVLWYIDLPLASLLVGAIPLVGSAAGRCIGLLVDGPSTMHVGFAVLELTGAAFCFVAARMLQQLK